MSASGRDGPPPDGSDAARALDEAGAPEPSVERTVVVDDHLAHVAASEPAAGVAGPTGAPGGPLEAAARNALGPSEAVTEAARGRAAVAGARSRMTAEDILATLRAVFPTDTRAWSWTARADRIGPLAAELPSAVSGCSEGRAWGLHAEVRWRLQPELGYTALYLGTGEWLPEGFSVLGADLRAVAGEEAEGVHLWGKRDADGRYRSTRLAGALEYPALDAPTPDPRVPYELLLDPTGEVRYVRLTLREQD